LKLLPVFLSLVVLAVLTGCHDPIFQQVPPRHPETEVSALTAGHGGWIWTGQLLVDSDHTIYVDSNANFSKEPGTDDVRLERHENGWYLFNDTKPIILTPNPNEGLLGLRGSGAIYDPPIKITRATGFTFSR
jgi:hypothetical protein